MQNPVRLIIIGFVFLLLGAALPFLIVIGLLTNTLALNFLAYSCTVAGVITGFVGIALYRRPPT